jgi:tetratricopeptide (TPR) repeat protein
MKNTSLTKNEGDFRFSVKEARVVFEELFAVMNEWLDEIICKFPTASPQEKSELLEKAALLKNLSNTYIEEWLQFENKLGAFFMANQDGLPDGSPLQQPPELCSDDFRKGQGYFQLWMFDQAVRQFERVVAESPQSVLARMYLALGYLQLEQWEPAYRQFETIIPLTDDLRIKAISYNVLGCIEMKRNNMQKANDYFQQAKQLAH